MLLDLALDLGWEWLRMAFNELTHFFVNAEQESIIATIGQSL
jgi:hypothetical protein